MPTPLHPRRLIRDAAKAALLSETAAGTRVVTSRRIPWRPSQLPGIGIYTLEETTDPASAQTAPRELKRHLELAIEAFIRADEDTFDDELDAIAREIEVAIAADDTLGGTASDCWLTKTEFDFGTEGDQQIVTVRLIFRVTYFGFAPDANDGALEDLVTVTSVTNLGGSQEAGNRAQDVVDDLDNA